MHRAPYVDSWCVHPATEPRMHFYVTDPSTKLKVKGPVPANATSHGHKHAALPLVASSRGSPFNRFLRPARTTRALAPALPNRLKKGKGATIYATYQGFLCRKLPDLGLVAALGGPSPSLDLRTLS